MTIKNLRDKILNGGTLNEEEAYFLLEVSSDELYEAAADITAKKCNRQFDSCSIINAKSGSCSENCKWCAQSAHWKTGCATGPVVDREECLKVARLNADAGVKRFSLVTSGKSLKGNDLKNVCRLLRDVKEEVGIFTCASLGLLNREELQQVWDSGARRYHCNLETAPSYFGSLCTTHSTEDKINTIKTAKEIGFEICSGGIIGMGETARQRVEFALKLREIDPVSIPINILCPIPGTPLENAEPISEEDILTTVAIFRFIHPDKQLRFAGGRTKLSKEGQIKAMKIGINGGIVGDLLTTLGSLVEEDRQNIAKAGYTF